MTGYPLMIRPSFAEASGLTSSSPPSRLGLFTPALTWSIQLVDGPVPVNISTQPGIDPMMVSLAVFFACLALVIRYGNALKKDSDSIA